MSQSSIVSTISSPVTLGSLNFSNNLTIDSTGEINVSTSLVGVPIQAIYGSALLSEISLTNFGTIIASSPSVDAGAIGVELLGAANVNNYGRISGEYFGILMLGGGTLVNSGTIVSSGTALDIAGPAYALNNGLISGPGYGVVESATILRNVGTIISQGTGVYVDQNSTLDNTGQVIGRTAAYLAPGAEVINAGTISTNDMQYALYATGQATLELLPGAKFNGFVNDTANEGTILLGGTSSGSIDLGATFSGFNTITFFKGAEWQIEGASSALTSGQIIDGFSTGDTIVLDGFYATSKTYIPGTGAVLSNGTSNITLALQGNFSSNEILIRDVSQGTVITAPCFVKETHITTDRGGIPVEQLKIGDLVLCRDGILKPIKWIGLRSYDGRLISTNRKALPICIRQNALGDGVPIRDLFVSPDHSLCEAGRLVTAEQLLNGISIIQLDSVDTVSYFHIELEEHDIIFAENCPVETFLNVDCRERFQNARTYNALYPEMCLKNTAPCLPRIDDERELNVITSRIIERARSHFSGYPQGNLRGYIDEVTPFIIRGWAQDSLASDTPILLHFLAGIEPIGSVLANQYRDDLRMAGLGSGYHGFTFNIPEALKGAQFQVVRRSYNGIVQTLPLGAHLSNYEEYRTFQGLPNQIRRTAD